MYWDCLHQKSGNDEIPLNVGCQSADSQTQGDKNAAALTGEQTFPEVKVVPKKPTPHSQIATLNVDKEVICPAGFEDVCPTPSEFTINIAGNNPDPASFPGSSASTPVSLGSGMYEVTEIAPAIHTGLIALDPVFSPDCSGDIQAGQELSCTITNQFTDTIPVGTRPVYLEYSPTTENIYVANLGSNTVTVIDSSNTVAGTINVGTNPIALEYSPTTENIYVANRGTNTVTVIDSSDTVAGTINVGTIPSYLEYSPATENIYVANRGTNTVTVIPP